jgi:patatin-like phospholipase/acyl hydrolase
MIKLFLSLLCIYFWYSKSFEISHGDVCNILSLSGGGSFGAVEIGILKNIYLPQYDIITGISVGALNAGLLSYYNSKTDNRLYYGIKELENLYINMKNSDVYENDYLDIVKYWSYYSTKPFRKTISNIIKNLEYDIYTKNRLILIGSTNLKLSILETFEFNKYNKLDQVDILMASTALPFIFPPIMINETLYVDGGTISNQILLGIKNRLNCKFYNITYIEAHHIKHPDYNITSFYSYINRIGETVYSSFDNQMSIIAGFKCTKPIGKIYHYYSNDERLKSYSTLNMENGQELLNIGNSNHTYQIYDYC